MKLTVLVPVYNEVNTILQAIEEVEKITVPDKEVIIIDNCSTDGTRELLEGLKTDKYMIIYNDHNTISGSLINGMKMAKGEYLYSHHADLEYDPSDAMKMLAVAEQGGYDVVIGSRLKGKKDSIWDIVRDRPAFLASMMCTALINRWYGKNFTDVIGTHLFRTATIRQVPVDTYGQGYIFEHISRICKRGLKMTEVAVSYHPRSYMEGKKIKPYHIVNALFAMFKVRYFG